MEVKINVGLYCFFFFCLFYIIHTWTCAQFVNCKKKRKKLSLAYFHRQQLSLLWLHFSIAFCCSIHTVEQSYKYTNFIDLCGLCLGLFQLQQLKLHLSVTSPDTASSVKMTYHWFVMVFCVWEPFKTRAQLPDCITHWPCSAMGNSCDSIV